MLRNENQKIQILKYQIFKKLFLKIKNLVVRIDFNVKFAL